MSRRSFLTGAAAAAGAVAAASLTGCSPQAAPAESEGGEAAGTSEVDWLGVEPEIPEDEITEVVDAEVVVVGGGTAGLFAACAAAEAGAKTVMLEQFGRNEGHGVRDDLGVYNSKVMQEAGAEVDLQTMKRYFQVGSGYYHNGQLMKVWEEESGATFDWYAAICEKAGFPAGHRLVNPPEEQRVSNYPYAVEAGSICCFIDWGIRDNEELMHSDNPKGQGVLNDYCDEVGVDSRFNTQMVKLIKEGDRVTGCIAQADDKYIQFNASKGVILCTGGYMGNLDMLYAIQPDIKELMAFSSSCFPGTDGLGIKAGIWAGGRLDPLHSCSLSPDALIPLGKTMAEIQETGEMNFTNFGMHPFLRVNMLGERFMNEDDQFDSLGHALLYQPEKLAITIYGSNYKEQLEEMNVYNAFRYFPYDDDSISLLNLDNPEELPDAMVERGLIAKSDTLEGLAEQLGIPVDTFLATVKRYNELCAKGVDEDFAKPGFRMKPVDTPPYYGDRFTMDGSHTIDGLIIDKDMRVLDENNQPIAGLYAAGDCSGCFLGVTYLGTYAGIAAGRSITFGRHAGIHAATQG